MKEGRVKLKGDSQDDVLFARRMRAVEDIAYFRCEDSVRRKKLEK